MLCTKTLNSGTSGSEEGVWLKLRLISYEKHIFSFFKRIAPFYVNVAALSTFKRHVPASHTPVRVSAGSILPDLWVIGNIYTNVLFYYVDIQIPFKSSYNIFDVNRRE